MTVSSGVRAFVGLGSNLGDRRAHLEAALAALAATPGVAVSAVSPAYENPPVGGPPQDEIPVRVTQQVREIRRASSELQNVGWSAESRVVHTKKTADARCVEFFARANRRGVVGVGGFGHERPRAR